MAWTTTAREEKVPLFLKVLRWNFRNVGRVAPGLMGRVALDLYFRPGPARRDRPDEKRVLEKARASAVSPNDRTTTVYEWGEAGRPGVFLLHGWSGSAAQMTPFVEPLIEAGYRVVALDAPGHGRNNPGQKTDPNQIRDCIALALRDRGPFHGVVNHSAGSVWCAYAVSEGVLAPRRAVCIAPIGTRERMMGLFTGMLHIPERVSVPLEERIDAMGARDFWPKAQFRIPTLIIHDRDDDFVPFGAGEELSRLWPDARLMATQGLKHRRILRDPSVVSAAVDFLRQS